MKLAGFAAALAFILWGVCGCAGQTFIQRRDPVEAGDGDEGPALNAQAMHEHPDDTEIRNYYLRHRTVEVQRYLALGDNARGVGALEQAEAAYQRGGRA